MKILITGLHGFIGRHLINALAPQHTIYGLCRTATPLPLVTEIFSWEHLQHGNLPEVDAIIHLAAIAHDTDDAIDAALYHHVNVELTRSIFDYFISSSASTFIHFSTVKAVADSATSPLTEQQSPAPSGIYGTTKLTAEDYICSRMNSGDASRRNIYILRPTMVHGEGCKGNLPLLYNILRHNIPWPLAAFHNKRTFLSIGNLTYVVQQLIDKPVESGTYNLCDDESLSTNDVVQLIGEVLNKKVLMWRINKALMNAFARVGQYLRLPLNPSRLDKLTLDYVVSNRKIKNALNIHSLPIDSRNGLRMTIVSFHHNK